MNIFYTSGTTGTPKKIIHSWKYIQKCAQSAIDLYEYSKESNVLNMYPNTSIAYYSLTSYPAQLAHSNLHNFYWNPYSFKDVFLDFNPTHIGCTPRQISILMKTKGWDLIDFQNIKIIIGAEKVKQELIDLLIAKGAIVFTTYGSTEFPPPVLTGINTEWFSLRSSYDISFRDNELMIEGIPTGDVFELTENSCRFIKRLSTVSSQKTWKSFNE